MIFLKIAEQEELTVDVPPAVDDVGDIDLANALNLSESEEEEEMEDIIDDFSQGREEVNRRPLAVLSDEWTDAYLNRINKA